MAARTVVDIARLAGVSRSTVSRVLNGHPNVSDDVRERVLKIIQKTGYQPNLAARSLRSKRSDIIGLVIPQSVRGMFTDSYFLQFTEGIIHASNEYNRTLALFVESDERTLIPRVTRDGHMDGVVVQVATIENQMLARLKAAGMPFVLAGRPYHPKGISYVDIDNVAGAYSAVAHLISLGHRRIAHVAGNLDTTAGLDRLQGYRTALENRGLKFDQGLVVEGSFTDMTSGYRAGQALASVKPEAVFAASDLMARGVIRAFAEAGLRVPEDVALVGFDDLPPATAAAPLLTTIRQPTYSLAMKCVQTLVDIIEHGTEPPRQVVLDNLELVIRESCGARLRERNN
jgi:LacI family transcriptional regulator